MLVSSSHFHPALLLTGLVAVIALTGCDKDDRARPIATSSAAEGPPLPESTSTTVDTAPPAPALSAVTPPADTPAKPRPKPAGLPRPSIDPGRKTPIPRADSGAKARAPADSSPAGAGSAAAATTQDKWLSYDPATNTVTFELIAGPFTFNGYRNGEGSLVLPSKANVVLNFVNKDGTPHSAEVIAGEGALPNAAGDPAIPRAYTNKVLEGLPQEASDVMRFAVPESGTYRIFCGVPGHGLSGMWIWMRVDPAAKAPSFGPTKA